MSIEEKSDGRSVQLKRVRLSFGESLQVKKKTAKTDDAKECHSANFIIEADSPNAAENRAKCKAAVEAACEQQFKNPDFHKLITEDKPERVCYRKGERFKNQETREVYAGYAGNMIISAKGPGAGQRRPAKMLDRHKRPVAVDDINDVFYNGSYVDVVISFYGTDKGGNGIFSSIEAIRSWQEGDRMGGGIQVDDDDFDDLDDEIAPKTPASDDDDDIG
jgi:hypothetical protein